MAQNRTFIRSKRFLKKQPLIQKAVYSLLFSIDYLERIAYIDPTMLTVI